MCFFCFIRTNIGKHSNSKSIIDSRCRICNYLMPGVFMYYKSPFKSAIIREKQKPLFSARFAARTRKNVRKAKTAFLCEIRSANSEKREKSKKPLFSARFAARTRKSIRKAKTAFIGEICCVNSEKRQKSSIVNYRMYLRRGVFICPIG